jgi:hypothetical protein
MAGRGKKQPSPARSDVIDAYIRRLEIAALQEAEFNKVISDLAADKMARKAELLNIAAKYVGVAQNLQSRKVAIEAIEKRFVELLRFKRKQELA